MTSPSRYSFARLLRRLVCSVIAAVGAWITLLGLWIFATPFPEPLLAMAEAPAPRLEDREGVPFAPGAPPAAALEPSRWLVAATLAGEDHRFEGHRGVDGWAILRAARLNVAHRGIYSGASTLSMQLVHLLDPGTPTRSLRGKPRQAVLALRLERRLSKDQILDAYLRLAPYGSGYVGAEAAAQGYFGVSAAALSPAQAALLAALPRAPSAYNPRRHLGRAQRRQRHILGLMHQRGVLDEAAWRAALAEPLSIRPAPRASLEDTAAARWLRPLAAAPHTTIDRALQRQVHDAARSRLEALDPAQGAQVDVAVVVLDVPSGEVRALVGSGRGRWFNAALAPRPLGQAPLPLALAPWLDGPGTLATLLPDVPQVTRQPGGRWMLQARNSDGRFLGPVRFRDALAAPRAAAAQVAWDDLGPAPGADRALALGLHLAPPGQPPWSPATPRGGAPTSLLTLAAAWATLPRDGRWLPPRLVRDAPPDAALDALSPEVARLLTAVLSDEERLQALLQHTPAAASPSGPVALAAFHDDGDRDHRVFAYTPSTLVAAWVGRLDGRPLDRADADAVLLPLVLPLLPHAPPPPPPEGAELVPICTRSGLRAATDCPHTTEELFLADTAPEERCDWHIRLPLDRRNGLLAPDSCDPAEVVEITAVQLPPRWRRWARQRRLPTLPADLSPLCPLTGGHHLFPWPPRRRGAIPDAAL